MMHNLSPVSHSLKAEIKVPGSKSISNRALLLAALAEGVSEIRNLQISDDIRHMAKALRDLGVAIDLDEVNLKAVVGGCNGQFPKKHSILWCGESGTLARFLICACAAASGAYYFDAAPSLRLRPMATLVNALSDQGCVCIPNDAEHLPFTLISASGLNGGKVFINAAKTGQGVSALLMCAPFAKNLMVIKTENLTSRSYVELTLAMMAEFGIHGYEGAEGEFMVQAKQSYVGRDYVVEPDLTTASYFWAAAAITQGGVTIPGIERQTVKQGDIVFLSILEQMGCRVSETPAGIKVQGPTQLYGIEVNLQATPDLFMTLAAIAPLASSPTLITGLQAVRYKESDRLSGIAKNLVNLGVRIEVGEDWLKIYPSAPVGTLIETQHDHRLAMAFSVLSLKVPGVSLDDASCVRKSCPEFFDLWQSLVKI